MGFCSCLAVSPRHIRTAKPQADKENWGDIGDMFVVDTNYWATCGATSGLNHRVRTLLCTLSQFCIHILYAGGSWNHRRYHNACCSRRKFRTWHRCVPLIDCSYIDCKCNHLFFPLNSCGSNLRLLNVPFFPLYIAVTFVPLHILVAQQPRHGWCN